MMMILPKWVVPVFFIVLRRCSMITSLNDDDDTVSQVDPAQVEVRAVFINCELDGRDNISPYDEASRFEREELFKHSALRDCCKKLAVTVKIASEPNLNSGDEYLPIEHVFEGANKKRVRLLDPYVLRLHRDSPLQAYKLRRIDTITGVLTNSESNFEEKYKRRSVRNHRDLEHFSGQKWSLNKSMQDRLNHKSSLIRAQETKWIESLSKSDELPAKITHNCDNRPLLCAHDAPILSLRNKRSEHNIVVDDATNGKPSQWIATNHNQQIFDRDLETAGGFDESARIENYDIYVRGIDKETRKRTSDKNQRSHSDHKNRRKFHESMTKDPKNHKDNDLKTYDKLKSEKASTDENNDDGSTNKIEQLDTSREIKSDDNNNFDSEEKDYAVYEIGDPELWYSAHLQLFEKLSTPDGKTLWNDLTKGEKASISSQYPEWMGPDLNVRYRPAEWLPRDQYTLPDTKLCLLAPIRDGNTSPDNVTTFKDGNYIVVPVNDIMGWQDDGDDINKRNDNYSYAEFSSTSTEQSKQGTRRVIVRTSRALLKADGDRVMVASQGSDRYLTLPHLRLHHAQIDLEARADKNELVRIGASGRISTVVADSTRRTRTVITVQAANTGLAAARFRVVARDCGPALENLINEKGNPACATGPVLLPPRHTQNLRLELPVEIPLDTAHCSVVLLNADDETVAVRDVVVKKGDRCFCVWHCDCVCLSDDPKLLCREMAEARQAAAGLPARDRTRHSRSVYCADNTTTDVVVVVIGVIFFLFFLGIIKAILGLMFRCIGTWGLTRLLHAPRKLDRYYESSLSSRPVEYDEQGWPIHPDTKQRTVHLVSWPMEFILNTIFFISIPCILIQDALKKLCTRCSRTDGEYPKNNNNKKKCSHDMQGAAGRARRRRRRGLRKWMTPGAQALSSDVWQKDLPTKSPVKDDCLKPLLLQDRGCESANETHDSAPDSEQDDTNYVLTQMQKSRESLAFFNMRTFLIMFWAGCYLDFLVAGILWFFAQFDIISKSKEAK